MISNLPKRSIIVMIDDREKYPLLFPATIQYHVAPPSSASIVIQVRAEKARLKEGDYFLKHSPQTCMVERKGSPQELYTNFFTYKDRRRCLAAFRRLASATAVPILLCDFSLTQLNNHPDAAALYCEIARLRSEHNLQLLFGGPSKRAGPRRALGTLLLHIMLQESIETYPNPFTTGKEHHE